jgi:hypothetical protein
MSLHLFGVMNVSARRPVGSVEGYGTSFRGHAFGNRSLK